MKIKLLILGLGLGASILAGCNDDFSSIGTSIQPGDDTIAVYMDTFQIQATTVQLDSIYARSTSAQLGELYDPLYGNLVSDYMCQFYCPSDFQFKHTPYEGKIDSVEFNIYYNGSNKNGVWVGDSLAPMRAEIFKITSPLQKNFYTNIDPKQYCNMQESMGAIKYSKTECRNKKCVIFGELSNGNLNLEEIPVQPLHDMRIIKGTLRELAENPISDTYDDKTDDYVFAELTDENPVTNAFSTLENIYPNIMGLEYVNRKKSIEMTPEMYGKTEGKSNIELFSDFYKMQNGKEIEPESVKIIERIFKEIGGVNDETD